MRSEHLLWYTKPAAAWTDALPLGNGRIGAMVFSGVAKDRWALNEDTLWSGYPRACKIDDAPAALEKARALMKDDQHLAAEKVLEQGFTGMNTHAYMPLGDLLLSFPGGDDAEDYIRSLDLETGISRCSYVQNGACFLREGFVCTDGAHSVLAIRISADKPAAVSFKLSLDSQLKHGVSYCGCTAELRGEAPGTTSNTDERMSVSVLYSEDPALRGMLFAARAQVIAEGGCVAADADGLRVESADSAVIYFGTRTSFNGYDRHPYLDPADYLGALDADFAALKDTSYDALCAAHSAAFAAVMNRVDFVLANDERADRPTDERLRAYQSSRRDDALYELIFNYGRYLTVAGSQPGTQATNIQGIWNELLLPPWRSNYTININTEMNYYPTEMCNLSEMHGPMFDLIEKICIQGRQTAKDLYNARGSACHHNTDLWGLTNPVSDQAPGCVVWSFWPMSLGWMCRHMFDHYLYTLDEAFLRERALPCIREAARFYLDVLQRNEAGLLDMYPATSPENKFIIDGKPCPLAKSSEMNNSIVREVLANYISALDILGADETMRAEAEAALKDIQPFRTGSKGQILEWDREYEEAEPHHRHTSHLYGLHPGRQIDPVRTPELADAARRTLELRGDDGTGWSLGWKINFWARLNDGDHALLLLKNQLRFVDTTSTIYVTGGGTYLNLFDAHPPFQIDGNYGACSGIAEMLLRSDPDRLTLLPALPGEWANGSISGLRGMGNTEVSLRWADGKLVEARIVAAENTPMGMDIYLGTQKIGEISRVGENVFTF